MAFLTGSLLIDAPASALNNSGEGIPGARTDNTSSVKFIRAQDGKTYPYISGQAVRYWLRNTLESTPDIEWQSSPIYRGDKVAYADGNPILYWDDDLFGYMRAPSKREYGKTKEDEAKQGMTPIEEDEKGNPRAITRASPLRIGTLVSIGPVTISTDFGTMSRHDGDPVPYEHQFYRAFLHSLFAIDLGLVGKFFYRRRSGFQNLDSIRADIAIQQGLEHLEDEQAYRLATSERTRRVRSLLLGLGQLNGGAKQAIHYTDVSPAVAIFAIVRGGNHPFNYLFSLKSGELHFEDDVFKRVVQDLQTNRQLLSPVCVAWKPGFQQQQLDKIPAEVGGIEIFTATPQTTFATLANYLVDNPDVMDA